MKKDRQEVADSPGVREAKTGNENARLMLEILGNAQKAQTTALESRIETLKSEIAIEVIGQTSKAILNIKGSE